MPLNEIDVLGVPCSWPQVELVERSSTTEREATCKFGNGVHLDESSADDEVLLDFKERANSIYHASCTCRMGRTAQDSVTDARLRVHGIAGLRVIDASAFPNVTSGNTNAPVMMLAARGAEMILQDTHQPMRMGGAA